MYVSLRPSPNSTAHGAFCTSNFPDLSNSYVTLGYVAFPADADADEYANADADALQYADAEQHTDSNEYAARRRLRRQ